jgi:hypothetical protein
MDCPWLPFELWLMHHFLFTNFAMPFSNRSFTCVLAENRVHRQRLLSLYYAPLEALVKRLMNILKVHYTFLLISCELQGKRLAQGLFKACRPLEIYRRTICTLYRQAGSRYGITGKVRRVISSRNRFSRGMISRFPESVGSLRGGASTFL